MKGVFVGAVIEECNCKRYWFNCNSEISVLNTI